MNIYLGVNHSLTRLMACCILYFCVLKVGERVSAVRLMNKKVQLLHEILQELDFELGNLFPAFYLLLL